jgi:hypothetical protein
VVRIHETYVPDTEGINERGYKISDILNRAGEKMDAGGRCMVCYCHSQISIWHTF